MEVPLYHLLDAAIEERSDTSYFWDNRLRTNRPHAVMQLTLAGECFFRHGGQEVRITPGQAFLFAAPEPSSYGYPEGRHGIYRHQFIAFVGANSVEWWRAVRERFGSVIEVDPLGETQHYMREIILRFAHSTFKDRFEESDYLYRFLSALVREQLGRLASTDPVEQCHHHILNHYRNPFNIKNLLGDLGKSREHISREFTRRHGVPPATLLRQLRLQAAKELLSLSSRSLADIAREVGLTDARGLCRLFRQHEGTTPDRFRQTAQGRLPAPSPKKARHPQRRAGSTR